MRWIGAFSLLFSTSLCLAESNVPTCGSIASYKDILKCAELRSFEVKRAEASVARSKLRVESVGLRLNPELSLNVVSGEVNSDRQTEADVSLGFPIELGGKRSARTRVAQRNVIREETDLAIAQQAMKLDVLLNLHRLRQLYREEHMIDESLSTFTKLVKQYERRLQLAPEQQVTISVFRLSQSDYDLKKVEITEQIAKLDAYFKLTTGLEIAQIKKYLPEAPKVWPSVVTKTEVTNSPRVRLLQADLDIASAESMSTATGGWPTLVIGPSLKHVREPQGNGTLLGINLSFGLPLFNRNGPASAEARSNETLATIDKERGATTVLLEREAMLAKYNRSVEALKRTLSSVELERRHQSVEGLFLRGMVPSSLVIEAHRTLVDFEKSRNEREFTALESLFAMQVLDGTVKEFEL